MRRLASGFIALTFVAAACGGSDAAEPSDSAAPVSEPADTEAPATDPPAIEAPVTDPPATDPPATDPPATDPPATDPPATDVPAAELELIGRGEYDVGVQTITINDEARARPLTVDVWFPLSEGSTGDPHRYTFITGDYYESPSAVTATTESISPDGPFPLVVYSHGSGGIRYIHSDYTEFLASHGYLVVAPDHTGNTAVERVTETSDDSPTIALNRPLDVRVVIDAMVDPASPETAGLGPSVDAEQIAVTGHSFGGFTTYAVASGYANDLGSVDPDPRVDAIIPLAPAVGSTDPANQLLSDGRLESISIPALVMVGTDDTTTPVDPNVTRAWELTQSAPSYRLELVAAEHNTFTDLCDYLDFFPQLPEVSDVVLDAIESQAAEGCSEGDMPLDRAQELTNTFAISFLDSVFEGTDMIDVDAALPDDIVYQAK